MTGKRFGSHKMKRTLTGKERDMFKQKFLVFPIVLILLGSGAVVAAETGRDHRVETGSHQLVKGIDIYYGIVPAQVTSRHPSTHEERKMHRGAAGKDAYHLIVALHGTGGRRITDAEVAATVGEFGMAGTRKTLEPMRIAETISFGNYFSLRGKGLYRIAIEIRRVGKQGAEPIEALFDYRLQ
jgi:hypothetical protein